MDAFESLVSLLLRREGYWTRSCVKVELTKSEKRAIGRHSTPRWEIDIVAYKAATNEVLAVECKSFLDSPGVIFRRGEFEPPVRYKLFSDPKLCKVVLARLAAQLEAKGMCRPRPKVALCLATGRIASRSDRKELSAHFTRHGWRLLDDDWIREQLAGTAQDGYENDLALVGRSCF